MACCRATWSSMAAATRPCQRCYEVDKTAAGVCDTDPCQACVGWRGSCAPAVCASPGT